MLIYTDLITEQKNQGEALNILKPLVESGELVLVDARIQVFGKETPTTMIVANERATKALNELGITVHKVPDSTDLQGFETHVSGSGLKGKLGNRYGELVKALNSSAAERGSKASLEMPEEQSSRFFH